MTSRIRALIRRNRSCRRFQEHRLISEKTLKALVDLARLSASGANLQPLKFAISRDPATNALIFPALAWAGYLKDWDGPAEGERPAAYILILGDTEIRAKDFGHDAGIASQSILLGAVERGMAGCMVGSITRDELRARFSIPDRFHIELVIALGYPAEKVKLETASPRGSIRYWRDARQVHHVPKRALSEIIYKLPRPGA